MHLHSAQLYSTEVHEKYQQSISVENLMDLFHLSFIKEYFHQSAVSEQAKCSSPQTICCFNSMCKYQYNLCEIFLLFKSCAEKRIFWVPGTSDYAYTSSSYFENEHDVATHLYMRAIILTVPFYSQVHIFSLTDISLK